MRYVLSEKFSNKDIIWIELFNETTFEEIIYEFFYKNVLEINGVKNFSFGDFLSQLDVIFPPIARKYKEQCLIVIDSAERNKSVFYELYRYLKDFKVLITSREYLRIDAENITLQSMKQNEAIELFKKRIGKNERISDKNFSKLKKLLKSQEQSNEFYAKMWSDLEKYGKWKGEIYNRRKNGEIYPELLSITAITNNKGETTHYLHNF